jgi:hypothetical protein
MNIIDIKDKLELQKMLVELKKLWIRLADLPDSPTKDLCLEEQKKFIFTLELCSTIFEHGYLPADFLRSDIFSGDKNDKTIL